jgi:hypothetical protein
VASFTWARDQVVKSIPLIQIQGRLCPYFSVTKLFQRLFTGSEYKVMLDSKPSLRHPDDPPRSFGTVFENAMMHFNHFIGPQEQGVLALPYLLYFMTHCLFFFRCLTPGHRALAAAVASTPCQHRRRRRLRRINTPHRRCGVSTLTATMTAAAMAAPSPLPGPQQQPSQDCHRPHDCGTVAYFLFSGVYTQPACRLLASLPAPSWPFAIAVHGPTKAVPAPPSPPRSHQRLRPSLPPRHQCPHHHHARVSTLTAGLLQHHCHRCEHHDRGSTVKATRPVA